jgi:hypothetical protein
MREHAAGCAACRTFTQRALAFESRLSRALQVDLPDTPAAPVSNVVPLRPRPRRRAWQGWLALAASVLVVVGVSTTLWTLSSERTLAAAVVAHMAEEPAAWTRTDVPVSEPKLDDVLSQSKLRVAPSAGLVSYANSCTFRGYSVPHLVVQSAAGPVTVMVLVHETVKQRMRFDEGGYRGTIVPVTGHGSLAVLMKHPSDRQEVDSIAARVLGAIVWTP